MQFFFFLVVKYHHLLPPRSRLLHHPSIVFPTCNCNTYCAILKIVLSLVSFSLWLNCKKTSRSLCNCCYHAVSNLSITHIEVQKKTKRSETNHKKHSNFVKVKASIEGKEEMNFIAIFFSLSHFELVITFYGNALLIVQLLVIRPCAHSPFFALRDWVRRHMRQWLLTFKVGP